MSDWEDIPNQVDSTNVPTTQLQAQGMKYTPDQMAAFDRGRGNLLAMETKQANPNLGLDAPPQAEINNLNPTALAAFNQSTAPNQLQDSSWEDVPIVKGTSIGEKYVYGKTPLAEATGSLAAGADFVAPVGAVLGGISGLGATALNLISKIPGLQSLNQGDPTKTIEKMSALQLGTLLEKYYPDAYKAYLRANNPIHKFSEFAQEAGGKVTDITNSPVAGTAVNLLTQIVPFLLGDRALAKTIKTPTPKFGPEDQAAKGYTITGEGAGASALNKMGIGESITTKIGKPTDFDALKDEQPLGVDTTPDEMTAEFNNRQGAFNFDPLARGESGDMFGPNVRGTQDVTSGLSPDEMVARRSMEPSVQGELSLTNNETPDTTVAKSVISNIEGESGLKPTTNNIDVPYEPFAKIPEQTGIFTPEQEAFAKATQESSAWQKYRARIAEQQRKQFEEDAARNAKYGARELEPSQSSPNIEKMQPPINNRTGKKIFAPRGQRGAVNLGGAEEIAKRIENLKKGLMNIGRDRENFGVGDTVRLMNGKTGTITAVNNGKYQIKGKDFLDSVPVQGIDYKYKPSGMVNSAVGYPKGKPHPLGGVGKKQGGALDVRAIFNTKDPSLKPEEPKGVDIPLSDNEIVGLVYKHWNRSADLNDFKEGLRLEKKFNPNFPDEVLNSADTLWNNFEKGFRPKDKSVFGEMSSINQRDSSDTRPLEQAMEEIIIGKKTVKDKETGEKRTVDRTLADGKLTEADDLNWATKELFDPLHIIETNWHKPSGKIFNNIYSNTADIDKFWRVKLKEYMDSHLPFKQLARKDQLAVADAERFWDTTVNRQTLIDQGLMWPTKEMLMDKQYNGLSSKQADAYLSHAKGYDQMWKDGDITEQRLPGYMPHTWEGAWRVNIIDTHGVLGPNSKGLVEVIRKNTRYGANAVAKAAQEKGFEVEVITPRLGNKNGFITNLEKQIQMAGQFGKLGKAFQKMLVDIHNKALEGTITESLERRGVGGYLGEHGTRPENALMNPYTRLKNVAYNNRVLDLYEKAANDFARAGRNRQIIEGVARPFYRNIDKFKDSVNLIDAVDDLLSTATGFRRQEALKLDRFIKQMFIKAGVAPNTPSNILNVLNGYARLERINSANVGFAAEHGAFSLPGVLDLWNTHIDRKIAGEKQGDFMKALGAFSKDFVTFGKFRSADAMRAEKWANDNGLYHSNYYDEVQYQGPGQKIVNFATHGALNAIINRMKSVTFQMGYRYYRDIMPERQALEAAKNHTKKVMQSFDELDRPEIFKEGLGGHSIRTFNQIHLYNMARVFKKAQSYVQALPDHPIAAQQYLIGLGGLTAIWMALAGAKGIPLHDDWNILREWIMENHPNAILPSYEEAMERAGLPNWAVFGLVPTLTGADIRGTFTFNFSNSLSGAGLETAGALGSLVMEKIIGLITGKENPDIVYKNIRKLIPTTAVPWLEDYEAQKPGLGGNIPKPSKLERTTPRTSEEDLFYKLISKKAISESMRNEHIQLQKEIDARSTRARGYYVDLIAKKIAGFNTGSASINDLISEAMNKDIGFDPRQLKDQVEKKLKEMNMSSDVEYIEKAARSATMIKANKFNNINQLLHGGQLGQ